MKTADEIISTINNLVKAKLKANAFHNDFEIIIEIDTLYISKEKIKFIRLN